MYENHSSPIGFAGRGITLDYFGNKKRDAWENKERDSEFLKVARREISKINERDTGQEWKHYRDAGIRLNETSRKNLSGIRDWIGLFGDPQHQE